MRSSRRRSFPERGGARNPRRALDVDRRQQRRGGDLAIDHRVPVGSTLHDPLGVGVESDEGHAAGLQQHRHRVPDAALAADHDRCRHVGNPRQRQFGVRHAEPGQRLERRHRNGRTHGVRPKDDAHQQVAQAGGTCRRWQASTTATARNSKICVRCAMMGRSRSTLPNARVRPSSGPWSARGSRWRERRRPSRGHGSPNRCAGACLPRESGRSGRTRPTGRAGSSAAP